MALENYNTWTKVGSGITINSATQITFSLPKPTPISRLYIDKGANFAGADFHHQFSCQINSANIYERVIIYTASNIQGPITTIASNNHIIISFGYGFDPFPYLQIDFSFKNGSTLAEETVVNSATIRVGQRYYFDLKRTNADIRVEVYSGPFSPVASCGSGSYAPITYLNTLTLNGSGSKGIGYKWVGGGSTLNHGFDSNLYFRYFQTCVTDTGTGGTTDGIMYDMNFAATGGDPADVYPRKTPYDILPGGGGATIVSYTWWMNAVGTGVIISGPSLVSNPTLTYATLRAAAGSIGVHAIYLVVTDNYGITGQCSSTITLLNTPPTCNCHGPYPIPYLGSIALNSTGSSSPGGSIVSYNWWLNAVGSGGTLLASISSPTVYYDDVRTKIGGVGTRDLFLVVTDNDNVSTTCSTTITLATPVASYHFVKSLRNGLITNTTAGATDPMHYAVSGWYKVDAAGQSPILWSTGSTLTGRKDIIGLHPVGGDTDRLYFSTINDTGSYTLDTTSINFASTAGPCGNTGWHHFYMEVRGRRSGASNPTPQGRWITIIPDGNTNASGRWANNGTPPFTGDTGMKYNYTTLGIDYLDQTQAAYGWLSNVAMFSFNSFFNASNMWFAPTVNYDVSGMRVDYTMLSGATNNCPLGVSMRSGGTLTAFWPLIENYLDYQNHYNLNCG